MKVIIAGSRTITNYPEVVNAIEASGFVFKMKEAVCGMARGVDELGYRWALRCGIPVKEFPADWDKYGKRAGHIRNGQMANYADALILVWDGKSRGSANMLKQALNKGLLIYEEIVRSHENDEMGEETNEATGSELVCPESEHCR